MIRLVLLLIFIYILNASAQNPTFLSMAECLQRAWQNSYRLQAEEQRAEAARKNYRYESSQARPQISGELSREDRFLPPYNFRQQWALLHADWSLGDFLLKTAQAAQQDVLMTKAEKCIA